MMKLDDVAASPQEKQWYSSLPGVTLKRGALVVEGAQALQVTAPRRPELEVLNPPRSAIGERSRTACDVFLTNATWHVCECISCIAGSAFDARCVAGSFRDEGPAPPWAAAFRLITATGPRISPNRHESAGLRPGRRRKAQ